MSSVKDKKPIHPGQFQSLEEYHLQGFVDGLTLDHEDLPHAIEQRVDFCRELSLTFNSSKKDASHKEYYPEAYFADTFFSDTFSDIELRKLLFDVALPPQHPEKRKFYFLLLEPLSDLAALRAYTLDGEYADNQDLRNCIYRLNRGLLRILCALKNTPKESFEIISQRRTYTERMDTIALTEELLKGIKSLGSGTTFVVDIRFTSQWLEMPVYIFGCYAFHGMISPTTSALEKPWVVYRDYHDEANDFYSVLKADFEAAWAHEKNINPETMIDRLKAAKERSRTVFIGHGSNPTVMKHVRDFIELEPWNGAERFCTMTFDDEKGVGTSDGMAWRKGIEKSACAIIIVAKEDYAIERFRARKLELTQGKPPSDAEFSWFPRPNVMVELGYALASYGEKRVFIFREKGVYFPTNNPGEATAEFTLTQGQDGSECVESRTFSDRMRRFLETVAAR